MKIPLAKRIYDNNIYIEILLSNYEILLYESYVSPKWAIYMNHMYRDVPETGQIRKNCALIISPFGTDPQNSVIKSLCQKPFFPKMGKIWNPGLEMCPKVENITSPYLKMGPERVLFG